MPPFPSRSDTTRDGAGPGFSDRFLAELAADRPAAVKTFLDRYYNLDLLGGSQVSDQAWQVAIPAGPHAIIWTHAAAVNQALLGFLREL
jgi:hypothetical protein